MPSHPTVDVRLLRESAPMKEDADIIGWLDLHQRLVEAPESSLALTQRDLAKQWRRPETSVRRFLSRLAQAGWIGLETGRHGASISMGRPPAFVVASPHSSSFAPADVSSLPSFSAFPASPAPCVETMAPTPSVEPEAPVSVNPLSEPEMERFAEDLMPGGGAARRQALAHQTKDKAPALAVAAEACHKVPVVKTGKGTAKVVAAPRFPFMDTLVDAAAPNFAAAPVPEENAQAEHFETLRKGFVQWCFDECQVPKAKTAQNWNRWVSKKCGYSLEAIETAIGLTKRRAAMAELSRLDNPLTYTENFLRKPEVMREAQRMEDTGSSNVLTGPASWGRSHPLRSGSTKLVTTPEEMGVTPGMADVQRQNAALCEAMSF